MESIYVIGFILTLITSVTILFVIYRLSTTVVQASIKKIQCQDDKCNISLIYTYKDAKIERNITLPESTANSWKENKIISIYMNPQDTNAPKYVPTNMIYLLYGLLAISAILLLFCIYKLFQKPKQMQLTIPYATINNQ